MKKRRVEVKPTSYLAHYRKVDCARHSVKTHSMETSLFAKKFAGKIGLDLIGELSGLLNDFMIWLKMGKNGGVWIKNITRTAWMANRLLTGSHSKNT